MNTKPTGRYTPQQMAVIAATSPRIAVLAGPGSGKTTTLIGRLVRDFKSGYATPESTAVITFTNSAAQEVRQRLARADCAEPGYVGTLHGWCLREIQRGQITVLSEALAEEILQSVITENSIDTTTEKVRKVLMGQRGDAKTELAIKLYRRVLNANNAVDYDLILIRAAEWLESNSSATAHLYVDEYQDSGELDARIYEAIAPRTAFFVGDVDQAIYGFRGGKPENLTDIARRPDTEVFKLEANFRSVPEICAAANAVIRHNASRFDKAIVAQRDSTGPAITVNRYRGEATESIAVCGEIAYLIRDGTAPENIAVLVRYNAEKSNLTDALRALGVPVAGSGQRMPHDWTRAQATLTALATPTNVMAVVGWRMASGESWSQANATERQDQGAPLMPEYMRTLRSRDYQTNRDAIMLALKQDGISGGTLRAIDDLNAKDIIALLIAMREASQTNSEGVTVSTYHGAKGLEWPVVFMPACEDRMVGKGNPEEARRLFFVAITRARDRLHISAADQRQQSWGRRLMAETGGMLRFVAEMNLPPT